MKARWLGPAIAVVVAFLVVVILLLNVQTGPDEPGGAAAGTEGAEKPGAQGHMMHASDGDGRMMAMVAKDGPHYGVTHHMPAHGKYRLVYTIHPPESAQFGRHTDPVTGVAPWWEPFDVQFEFDYQGVPADDADEAEQVAGVPFREYFIGKQETHHMEVQAVWLPPIQMEGMTLPQDPDVIHLEADIHALEGHPNGFSLGEWIPYLRVEYELTPLN